MAEKKQVLELNISRECLSPESFPASAGFQVRRAWLQVGIFRVIAFFN